MKRFDYRTVIVTGGAPWNGREPRARFRRRGRLRPAASVLVNNAGSGRFRAITETEAAAW
jgi:hypothetical protein